MSGLHLVDGDERGCAGFGTVRFVFSLDHVEAIEDRTGAFFAPASWREPHVVVSVVGHGSWKVHGTEAATLLSEAVGRGDVVRVGRHVLFPRRVAMLEFYPRESRCLVHLSGAMNTLLLEGDDATQFMAALRARAETNG